MFLNSKKFRIRYKGFTLIEVIIAVAILGVGLMLVIELFSGGLRAGKLSEEYTKATNYARLKLEEIRLNPIIKEGMEEGSFDKDFRWKISIKEVSIISRGLSDDFKVPAKLYKIDLGISWNSGFKERSIGFETYKLVNEREIEEKS